MQTRPFAGIRIRRAVVIGSCAVAIAIGFGALYYSVRQGRVGSGPFTHERHVELLNQVGGITGSFLRLRLRRDPSWNGWGNKEISVKQRLQEVGGDDLSEWIDFFDYEAEGLDLIYRPTRLIRVGDAKFLLIAPSGSPGSDSAYETCPSEFPSLDAWTTYYWKHCDKHGTSLLWTINVF